MNAEFQRIARRDKKAFLSDQCIEIEENNRLGKTRALFKKIRDIKRIFYANFWAPKSLQMVIAAMKLKMLTPWKESCDQPRQHIKKQRHYFVNKSV